MERIVLRRKGGMWVGDFSEHSMGEELRKYGSSVVVPTPFRAVCQADAVRRIIQQRNRGCLVMVEEERQEVPCDGSWEMWRS